MTHREHPQAKRVMELSRRGVSTAMIAKLLKLQIKTVRLIKMAFNKPRDYAEWQALDIKRRKDERKEQDAPSNFGMMPEEKETCRLAKLWK